MNHKQVGDYGENIALEYLIKNGYRVLDKNFRALGTEIDLIALKKDELIFIEVKTRRNRQFGDAYEAVTERKMNHIIQTAQSYIQQKNLYQYMVRFDIIEIYLMENKLNHIKNAFILS
ncbi:MAG: YraN family protein [Tissierellia bacterium]|nr:YraN family protein [Tissierellia bacterium]